MAEQKKLETMIKDLMTKSKKTEREEEAEVEPEEAQQRVNQVRLLIDRIRELEHISQLNDIVRDFMAKANPYSLRDFKELMTLYDNNLSIFLDNIEPSFGHIFTMRLLAIQYLEELDVNNITEDFLGRIIIDNIPTKGTFKAFVKYLKDDKNKSSDFIFQLQKFVEENRKEILNKGANEAFLIPRNFSETFTAIVTRKALKVREVVPPTVKAVIFEKGEEPSLSSSTKVIGKITEKAEMPFKIPSVITQSECERLFRMSPWIKTVREIYISPLNKESEQFVLADVRFKLNGENIWNRPNKKFFELLCSNMNTSRQTGKILEIGDYKFRVLFLLTNSNFVEQTEEVFEAQRRYIKLLTTSDFGKIELTLEVPIFGSTRARRIFLEELQTIIEDRTETRNIENEIYGKTSGGSIGSYYEQAANILAYLYFGDEQTLFNKRLQNGFYKGNVLKLKAEDKADSTDENVLRHFELSKVFQVNRLGNMLYSLAHPTEKVIRIPVVNISRDALIAFSLINKNYEEILYDGDTYDVRTLYKNFNEGKVGDFNKAFVERVLLMNIPKIKPEDVFLEKPKDAEQNIFSVFYYLDKSIHEIRNRVVDYARILKKEKLCEYCKKHILVDEFKTVKLDENTPKIVAYCSQKCLEEGEFKEEEIPTDSILVKVKLEQNIPLISKGMKGQIASLGNVSVIEVVEGDDVKGKGDRKYVSKGEVKLKIKLSRKMPVSKDFPVRLLNEKNGLIGLGKVISESEDED